MNDALSRPRFRKIRINPRKRRPPVPAGTPIDKFTNTTDFQYGRASLYHVEGNASYKYTRTSFLGQNVRAKIVLSRASKRTPNFRALRKQDYPMNPFKFRKVISELNNAFPSVNYDWRSGASYSYDSYQGPLTGTSCPDQGASVQHLLIPSDMMAAADAKAVTKLLLATKDMKANLAQVMAERAQTIRLIGETATMVSKMILSLKRGDFVGASKFIPNVPPVKWSKNKKKKLRRQPGESEAEAISRQWLALQYGWKPLLDDIYGISELLAQASVKEVRAHARASSQFRAEDRKVWQETALVHEYSDREVEVRIGYNAIFTTNLPAVHSLAQTGMLNPALIAWELMPYSFVVDWFLPIGNWLSSLDATLGLGFSKGCKTVTTISRCHSRKFIRGKNGATTRSGGIRSDETIVTCERTALPSFPAASFPSFKNPVSFTHAANAIALLAQTASKTFIHR